MTRSKTNLNTSIETHPCRSVARFPQQIQEIYFWPRQGELRILGHAYRHCQVWIQTPLVTQMVLFQLTKDVDKLVLVLAPTCRCVCVMCAKQHTLGALMGNSLMSMWILTNFTWTRYQGTNIGIIWVSCRWEEVDLMCGMIIMGRAWQADVMRWVWGMGGTRWLGPESWALDPRAWVGSKIGISDLLSFSYLLLSLSCPRLLSLQWAERTEEVGNMQINCIFGKPKKARDLWD